MSQELLTIAIMAARTAADWLTLVEKFGLAANVKDAARKG
jgi:hypothetical protein